MSAIESEPQLRSMYAPTKERAIKKQLSRLDQHCRNFLALVRFTVLSTCDAQGNMDASPRGGEAGFIKVIDDNTVIVPDWSGNNRLDTFSNILATSRIGAIFLVPGVDEALRINGTASLRNDEAFTSLCEINGRFPKLVVHIAVKEAYLHCAKAIMRAQLWLPESKIERKVLPTMNEMLRDQIGQTEPAESQELMVTRHKTELYSTK
ncbi:MAG TPA: pyridoxamine 5'-phosphate oxidase family protein [Burkholderiales bacterium]|nr:pyridoxamine 5'-phosphate oxidase family protein [Burkholderiales bacterium]